ncbi:DHH family phosphoesterase [candidate division KSB1 bacterium]|nr:DHH family phosphoesterase [candidate division KSB1 bacterium]RQW01901.1 MAG: phosphoesterase [candidate division KSB1 bacterium]
MIKFSQLPNKIKTVLKALENQLQGAKTLLILLHNNPDPDAIASGFALAALADSLCGVAATIAYNGILGRAENRAMVSLLDIPLVKTSSIRYSGYDRIAMVDTQPGQGNNPLPAGMHTHIVFDHHASSANIDADLVVYNSKLGATATLLCELLMAAKVDIKINLATAIAYAIRSETQELRREANKRDIQAYLAVYPLCSLPKMGAITNPTLLNSYFQELAIALNRACKFRHLIFIPLGYVDAPEIIAEMSDLFLRRERTSWALAVGNIQDSMYLSLRTNKKNARAFRVIQRIVGDNENAGGHNQFAGGKIDLEKADASDMMLLEEDVRTRFAAVLGIKNANWKPLIEKL